MNLLYLDINKDKQKAIKYLKQKHSKYTKYIDNYNGEIIVDKDKDLIVGQVFVGKTGKDKDFITGLWVRDSYRGSGLGKRLLEDAIKKYGGIDLTVAKDNKVAVNMYKSHGFVNIKYDNDEYYWMKLKSKISKDDILAESEIYNNSEYLEERMIANMKDIYYNKDKFDSGEINLCFITGHSGSGKSTMGRNMAGDKIEHYELDDVVTNKMQFSMSNFKEYGDLIYSFFNGSGKKYYYTKEDVDNGSVKSVGDKYEELLIKDFISYSMKYAKSHKDTKFVVEGLWLLDFIEPSELKDYAVYIKGTSLLVSTIRAANRDSAWEKSMGNSRIKAWIKRVGNIKNFATCEKDLRKYYNYFSKAIEESSNYSYFPYTFELEVYTPETSLPPIYSFKPYYMPDFEPVTGRIQIVQESATTNMYFISQTNMDSKTLHPKVPDNYFTKNNYEDNKTKRVCFAPSIDQCLMGLSCNCAGKEYYVHTPDTQHINSYKPTKSEVPDSVITGEIWVKEDVKLKCIGKIKVIKDKGLPGKKFSYGNKTAGLYEWDWKWISRKSVTESADDIIYGLPELKKYPMPDEKHVLSAIKFFNYVSSENEEELAKNIKRQMKKYGIKPDRVGDKNRLKKYLTEDSDILIEFENNNFDGIKPILVFDIGDVLVGFRNNTMEGAIANSIHIPSDIAKDVYSYISNTFSKNYDYLDSASESDYYEYMMKHSPSNIKKYIPAALKAIVEDTYKLLYIDELLSKLKGEGYTMYYLSNWSRWSRDMLLKNGTFDFLKYFDGGIFSCDVKLSKPNKAIYELLASVYNIDLSKCIFFDDNPENIAASIDCGMYGVLFNKEYTQQEIYDSLLTD